jgi:flagellar biosynthesis protein
MSERNERPERPPVVRVAPAGAAALRHDRGSGAAPRLVAKGRGEVAERILALAAEHDVPVREDPDLLTLLAACELDREVPEELWGAVAEIIAFLYRVNGEVAPD